MRSCGLFWNLGDSFPIFLWEYLGCLPIQHVCCTQFYVHWRSEQDEHPWIDFLEWREADKTEKILAPDAYRTAKSQCTRSPLALSTALSFIYFQMCCYAKIIHLVLNNWTHLACEHHSIDCFTCILTAVSHFSLSRISSTMESFEAERASIQTSLETTTKLLKQREKELEKQRSEVTIYSDLGSRTLCGCSSLVLSSRQALWV